VDADDSKALNFEIDTWDSGGDSWFWVQVPQIDAASNTDYIWMYYGSPTVANGENAEVVWENGYVAVYHMNDKPGDATKILDSTVNANHGTKGAGAAAPTEVAGSVGKAQQFVQADGTQIALTTPFAFDTGTVLLFTRDMTYAYRCLAGYLGGGLSWLGWQGTYLWVRDHNSNIIYGPNVAPAAMAEEQTLAFVHDGATMDFHRNGALLSSVVSTWTTSCIIRYLGAGYTAEHASGIYDELRLSSVARTAEWIEAENLAITDAMLTYGAEDLPDAAVPVVPVPAIETAEALLCVAVAMAAVKQRHIILYVAAFILLLFTGFSIAETAGTLAVMPFCFAVYMLYMTALSVGRR
jgi:hypothetical protein